VVELNRAAAVGEAAGPEAGLAIVDRLTGLKDYVYLHSTRAELLRRAGQTDQAQRAYRRAIELTGDDTERRLFERRLASISDPPSSSPPRRTDGPARNTAPG
jgi:RNA polymerase sigma-70 factor (ECF subfamily)